MNCANKLKLFVMEGLDIQVDWFNEGCRASGLRHKSCGIVMKNKLKPTSLVDRCFNASLRNFHHVADDAILHNYTITEHSFSVPTNEKFQYIPTRQPRTD